MKQEYEDLQQKHKQFCKLLDEVEELNAKKRNLMNQLFDARTLDPSVKASIGRIADDMKEEMKDIIEIKEIEDREYRENISRLEEKTKEVTDDKK